METGRPISRRRCNIEENVLAMLDATDSSDTEDANDDRIAFLGAVCDAFTIPDNETPPTSKICEAVFQILRVGKSWELIMRSFQLLDEFAKRFPRVFVSSTGVSESSELVVVGEAWSPFTFNLDSGFSERQATGKSINRPLDSVGFHSLIQDLNEVVNETNLQALETKSLGKMMLFQYLVNFLEGDFVPRNRVYNETTNWAIVRESLLTMLLCSRSINYKSLMKDCLSIMCGLCQDYPGMSDDPQLAHHSQSGNIAEAIALFEVVSNTCTAMQKFLVLIMELDMLRKKADMQGWTTRADGIRTPLLEIIVDELTYDRDMLFPFLEIFNEPKWKVEIVLQYFSKYTTKPSVRTRRTNSSTEDVTFSGVLKSFSNLTSTRSITKKISLDVVQVLLAHAFQAHLSLLSLQGAETISNSSEGRDSSLMEMCEDVISAFSSLKRTHEKMEILPCGREALFTAATILATKS